MFNTFTDFLSKWSGHTWRLGFKYNIDIVNISSCNPWGMLTISVIDNIVRENKIISKVCLNCVNCCPKWIEFSYILSPSNCACVNLGASFFLFPPVLSDARSSFTAEVAATFSSIYSVTGVINSIPTQIPTNNVTSWNPWESCTKSEDSTSQ